MNKNHNKFRINHPLLKQPPATTSKHPTRTSFFSRVVQAVKEKAANAYTKL
jgi:hypothetical protein